MTIQLKNLKVRDIRHLDSDRVELRLIEGTTNFVDLLFPTRASLNDFLSAAAQAIKSFDERPKGI